MNFKEICEVFSELEQRVAVEELCLAGVRVWPLARLVIMQRQRASFGKRATSRIGDIAKLPGLGQLKDIIDADPQPVPKNVSEAGCDVLLYSRWYDYIDALDEGYYGRIHDPIYDHFSSDLSMALVEPWTINACDTLPRARTTQFHDEFGAPFDPDQPHMGAVKAFLLSIKQLPARLRLRSFRTQLDRDDGGVIFRDLLIGMHDLGIASDGLIDEVKKALMRVRKYEIAAEKILDRYCPKVVMVTCYYSPVHMAMIRACRRRGITVVDIQHGARGRYKPMNVNWTRIPEGGFDTMPDIFWCWGEESRNNNLRKMPDGDRAHDAIVGGNLWVGDWLKGRFKGSQALDNWLERARKAERTILVGLQPFAEPLEPQLLQAVLESPKTWFWMFRLHPQTAGQLDKIVRMLEDAGAENFAVAEPTIAPLYALFGVADVLVTSYSSVYHEAQVFGVPGIFISPEGQNMYPNEIKNGRARYAETPGEIVEAIKVVTAVPLKPMEKPYIETSKTIARAALDKIMSASKV